MTNKRWLTSCLIAVSASVACLRGGRHTPTTKQAAALEAPAVSHARSPQPYRPLHKGGADLSTGLYIREDDDVFVNTPMPMVVRRTYLSGDRVSRQFGIGAMHPGEWWLYGDSDPRLPWADLILANRSRVHFTLVSGTSLLDAVLRHDSTPTAFSGALLRWSGSTWEMRFRDGGLARFLGCAGAHDMCSLVERRDADGHRIAYVRDASGRLLSMESEGDRIAFEYDDQKRIIRAYDDTSQHAVRYTYDEGGRLVRATASDGTIRTYAYDDRDELVEIREPGRIIRNWFDESGRFARQEVRASEDDTDPYLATARYVVDGRSVVQADFDEGDGLTRYRYNSYHYIVSETFDADSAAPITFVYNRDATTNVINDVTMACDGPAGPFTRRVLTSDRDDRVKHSLMSDFCRPRR